MNLDGNSKQYDSNEFDSLAKGGLRLDSFPMRLFDKGNSLAWDPKQIDFSFDLEDWLGFSDDERSRATFLVAQFVAGEEAVTKELRPFISAMSVEGRFEDEVYLTQFCLEEAKHTLGFRRWMDAVGLDGDLHSYVTDNPYYREIFCVLLPERLRELENDPSPRNQVIASITYNHVVEGALALTGYRTWDLICRERGVLPGMQTLIRKISIDERRHMAWGTYTCRRHIASDGELLPVAESTMAELMNLSADMIGWVGQKFSRSVPFGIDNGRSKEYAMECCARRLRAIASASGQDVSVVEDDWSSEKLEEELTG